MTTQGRSAQPSRYCRDACSRRWSSAFQQPDIRKRLMFTFFMLVVFRFVAHVPIPGVDSDASEPGLQRERHARLMNLFSGGALRKAKRGRLGVYPYITASIIMQLRRRLIPRLQALSQGRRGGPQAISLYTYWLAVPLAARPGLRAAASSCSQLGRHNRHIGFTGGERLADTGALVVSMAAGTMFLVWIGELITENGIGNGISIIIFGGIVSGMPRLPGQHRRLAERARAAIMAFCCCSRRCSWRSIVIVQEAQRRIPVQYARATSAGGACTASRGRRTSRCGSTRRA